MYYHMEKELTFKEPVVSQHLFEKRTIVELSDDQMEVVDSGNTWTITLVTTSLFCVSVYVGYKEAERAAQ